MNAPQGAPAVEIGLLLSCRHARIGAAAQQLQDAVESCPWLRIAGIEPGDDKVLVTLAVNLGSAAAVKNAEPEVQIVMGHLVDLIDDMQVYDIAFARLPDSTSYAASFAQQMQTSLADLLPALLNH